MKPTAKNIQRIRKALLEHEMQLSITVRGYEATFNGHTIFEGIDLQEMNDKLNLYNTSRL